ncbi:MAG TPA: M20/M25/M40 family metallo-hydrolase [Anaerolineaceae bacterium]|nr:M20/M25/M40 family metallo-hydrolase [Anaerolineaceae bacterium]
MAPFISPRRPHRRTIGRVLTFALLTIILVCALGAAAVSFSLPYDMHREILQVTGGMIAQRLFATTPEPIAYPPELAAESAQIGEQADLDHLLADVTWLADDARQGRLAGTASEDEAGAWLVNRLQGLGLQPFSAAGLTSYTLSFNSDIRGQKAEDLIAVLPGTEQPERFILLGAHYDHVGVAADGQVYNGADDDATGVAAVLEAARVLSTGPAPRETIVFVLFSGEEGGRRGSSALGRLLTHRWLIDDCQMLNLEVLGALPGMGTYLDVWDEESATTNKLAAAVQTAGEALDIPISRQGRDPSSDATRLLAYHVPSVTLDVAYTGEADHPNMHTPADDVDAIDPQGFLMATRAAIAATWILANDGQ